MKHIFAGFDLGGTFLKFGLGDAEGRLLYKDQVDSQGNGSIEEIIGAFREAFAELSHRAKSSDRHIIAAGVGSPGAIDRDKGIILGSTPNIPAIKGYPLGERLEKEFSLPLALENDANLAALAEALTSAGKGYKSVLVLTLGTGVGGGFVVDGKIFRGEHNSALEVGHISIDHNGRLCRCGRKGCIEAYASGAALVKAANSGERKFTTPKAVFKAAKEGFPPAVEAVKSALDALSSGIVNLQITFDPGCVALGGGLLPGYREYWNELERLIERKNIDALRGKIPLLTAKTGGDAGLIGAVLAAAGAGK